MWKEERRRRGGNNGTEEGKGGIRMKERKERINLRKVNKREEHGRGRRERRKVERKHREMRRVKDIVIRRMREEDGSILFHFLPPIPFSNCSLRFPFSFFHF